MTVDHPPAGTLTLAATSSPCRAATLRIVIDTAEPGTEDAERPVLNPGK